MRTSKKPTIWAATILSAATVASVAAAGIGDWVAGERARVRLIAAGIEPDGRVDAAIEIQLAPGWKTYWRTPGDAGIAPLMDFSGSVNLADATVAFPSPHRYDDGFGISNVLDGVIVLPVTAIPVDATAPVDLKLSLDIGVCETVCIPEHFDAALHIPADAADEVAAMIIADAQKAVPGPPEPGTLAVERLWRDGGDDKRPEFALTAFLSDPPHTEVYVEGPVDWYAGVPQLVAHDGDRATYRVVFDRRGAKTPIDGSRFRVTIVGADRAIEQNVSLD